MACGGRIVGLCVVLGACVCVWVRSLFLGWILLLSSPSKAAHHHHHHFSFPARCGRFLGEMFPGSGRRVVDEDDDFREWSAGQVGVGMVGGSKIAK